MWWWGMGLRTRVTRHFTLHGTPHTPHSTRALALVPLLSAHTPFIIIKDIPLDARCSRPATTVGDATNAERNSSNEKLAEGTDQAEDNEAAHL